MKKMNACYWENEGATKTFTHELYQAWIEEIPRDANVLDMGCGYGRISKQLNELGFGSVLGYDPSRLMISRAKKENPGPLYTFNIDELAKRKYELVICFALFTSCPEPETQTKIKELIERQTENSSYLYISDYLISKNPHYSEKYQQRKLGIHGCFGSENVVFRHHEENHFPTMFSGWRQINVRNISGKTLNGNPINMTQFLYKKG